MKHATILSLTAALALALAGCQAAGNGAGVPGDSSDSRPFAGIGEDEVVQFTGTEPFWGGEVTGTALTYSTPEDAAGATITVTRFAGRAGLSFSGELDGASFDMAITQGECSDGMSDRTYPFTVTLKLGTETRNGCAWSSKRPYKGPKSP